jgi:hypothetical protein
MAEKNVNFNFAKLSGEADIIEGCLIDGTPIAAHRIDRKFQDGVELWLIAPLVNTPMGGCIVLEGSLIVIAANDFRENKKIVLISE